MQKEVIRIYHKPGRFIFTVWDESGKPLYIGGTKDINAKSFKFAFPYADITGYYYPESWPDFEDEIDRQIAKISPKYNTYLRSSYTIKMILKYIKELLKKSGIPFTKEMRTRAITLFQENNKFEFRGENYIGKFDKENLIDTLLDEFGYMIVWNKQ